MRESWSHIIIRNQTQWRPQFVLLWSASNNERCYRVLPFQGPLHAFVWIVCLSRFNFCNFLHGAPKQSKHIAAQLRLYEHLCGTSWWSLRLSSDQVEVLLCVPFRHKTDMTKLPLLRFTKSSPTSDILWKSKGKRQSTKRDWSSWTWISWLLCLGYGLALDKIAQEQDLC